MDGDPRVWVVDDDPDVTTTLRKIFERAGHDVVTYPSAEDFRDAVGPDAPGCLVLDLHLPGMTGLELLSALREEGWPLPVIILSGDGDIPSAVEAVQQGALTFLEKPVRGARLLEVVRQALAADAAARKERAQQEQVRQRISRLTQRERQVLGGIVEGLASKQIAMRLGVSPRTIDVHRSHIIQKLEVNSLARLVRLAVEAGIRA